MNRYEIEVAKLEARTPLFYYPYSVKLKSDYAKELLALHYRENGSLRPLTPQDLALVTDERLKKFSGQYVFHYIDSKETKATRLSYIKQGALLKLGESGIGAFKELNPNVKTYAAQLRVDKDFEIIIGERVEIEQPTRLTFEDIPDLMGINEKQ